MRTLLASVLAVFCVGDEVPDQGWSARYAANDGVGGIIVNSDSAYFVASDFSDPGERIGAAIIRCDERGLLCANMFRIVFSVPQKDMPHRTWDVGGARFTFNKSAPLPEDEYHVDAEYNGFTYSYRFSQRKGLIEFEIPRYGKDKTMKAYTLAGDEGFLSDRFYVR